MRLPGQSGEGRAAEHGVSERDSGMRRRGNAGIELLSERGIDGERGAGAPAGPVEQPGASGASDGQGQQDGEELVADRNAGMESDVSIFHKRSLDGRRTGVVAGESVRRGRRGRESSR